MHKKMPSLPLPPTCEVLNKKILQQVRTWLERSIQISESKKHKKKSNRKANPRRITQKIKIHRVDNPSQKWPRRPQHPPQLAPPSIAPALFPNPIFPPNCPSASANLLPPAPPPPNLLLLLFLARLEPETRPSRWSTARMGRTARFLVLLSFRDPILLAASGSSAGSTSPKP